MAPDPFDRSSSGGSRASLTRRALTGCIALGLLSWTACTGPGSSTPSTTPSTTPKTAAVDAAAAEPDEPLELTPSGLALVRRTPRSMLWVRPDHHIGHYDDILITGVGFTYGRGQTALEPQQEVQVQEMLIDAMNAFTGEGSPVGRALQPGPCVLALQLGLKDMRLHISETSGSSISYVNSFGSATMIIEFRDSTTDEVLLRYASHRGLGGGPGTGRLGANLSRLGRALGHMVTDMTNELQKITPDTTVRTETECNDGIYKLTGRG